MMLSRFPLLCVATFVVTEATALTNEGVAAEHHLDCVATHQGDARVSIRLWHRVTGKVKERTKWSQQQDFQVVFRV